MSRTRKPNEDADGAEQLATVLGLSSKEIEIRGEKVLVEEFEILQLPEVLGLLKDITQSAQGGGSVTANLLAQSGEIGIKLGMLATRRPRSFFNRMGLGDGIALMATILEVNKSFFAHQEEFMDLILLISPQTILALNGSGPSHSLPETDSPLPKLEVSESANLNS